MVKDGTLRDSIARQSSYSHPLFFSLSSSYSTYRSVLNLHRDRRASQRDTPLNSVENAPLGHWTLANDHFVVYCFSAAQEWKGWRREETGCSFDGTTTVKWRGKFAQKLAKTVLRRAETFSDQDCGNRVYTNTLDAFLGSAWREGRLLLRQYREFLETLG